MGLKGFNLFKKGRPSWVGDISDDSRRIDVRRLISSGKEPLHPVIDLANEVAPGEAMIVDAPFDPAPLRRLLEAKGFESHGEKIAHDHWRIWLRRLATKANASTGGTGSAAKIEHDDEGWRVDVRGLPAPEPMLAVLALIDTPAVIGPIFVHLDREPVYLYAELAERHWQWTRLDSEPEEVRLRLYKEP